MNFEQVEDALPNGFHDGFLRSVLVDYIQRIAVFEIEVWVGYTSDDANTREEYRRVKLNFDGLLMCALGIPDQRFLDDEVIGLKIDSAPLDYGQCWQLPEPLPTDAFVGCFYFTEETNSSITFVAINASFEWMTEPRLIY